MPDNIPTSLARVARSLFASGEDQQRFIAGILEQASARPVYLAFEAELRRDVDSSLTDWVPAFVSVAENGRDTHTDRSYPLDLSSVFCASVLQSVPPFPELILDTCASPGGKSIFSWKLLQPKILVSNEAVGSRLGALISNLKRCEISPVYVLSMDSAPLAALFERAADVVVVDAPCSGQSLPAKGQKSMGAFHPSTINMNSNRQKRILANSLKTVAPGGYLAYMTCTFAKEENENVISWALKHFPDFVPVEVPLLGDFRSRLATFPCYRLFPFQGFGAGGFTCLLHNVKDEERRVVDLSAIRPAWKSDKG